MLPSADTRPPFPPQICGFASITLAIISDFLVPPSAMHARGSEMLRTSVPVTAVNKHTDPGARKDYIRFALHPGINIAVLSKSQSAPVKFTSQLRFQSCVERTIG